MHILSTADTIGGVWTYILDLARALPAHRFSVATMGQCPTDSQLATAGAIPNLRLYPSEWKLEWMENPWEDVRRSGEWLLRLEQELQPDVIHLNGYSHGTLPFQAPVLVVAHSCVLSWWRAVKGEDAPQDWNHYRSQVHAGLQAADIVVSPTRALLTELEAIYGEIGVSAIIHNGARTVPTTPIAKQPRVLAAGRLWDEAKNIQLLDQVAPNLDWPILVAGQTDFEHGSFAANHLKLLGSLPPDCMHQHMQEAAIWAHPALYEPFGLAVLEAAQAECTLVLSDIPTLRELWQDAALFVSPRDPSAWEDALNLLMEDPDLRQTLGARARERAAEYSLERCAHQYAALYELLT